MSRQQAATPHIVSLLLGVVGLALLAAGCGGDLAPPTVYEVNGEVTRLPASGAGREAEIWIRHEAIPDFVNSRGERVGMDAMTMPFRLSEGLSLAGIEVGTPVHFRLEVQWEGSPPVLITALEAQPDAAPDTGEEAVPTTAAAAGTAGDDTADDGTAAGEEEGHGEGSDGHADH